MQPRETYKAYTKYTTNTQMYNNEAYPRPLTPLFPYVLYCVDHYLLFVTTILTRLLVTVVVCLTQLNQLEKIQQECHLKSNISSSWKVIIWLIHMSPHQLFTLPLWVSQWAEFQSGLVSKLASLFWPNQVLSHKLLCKILPKILSKYHKYSF